jgi:hypothetical protein
MYAKISTPAQHYNFRGLIGFTHSLGKLRRWWGIEGFSKSHKFRGERAGKGDFGSGTGMREFQLCSVKEVPV